MLQFNLKPKITWNKYNWWNKENNKVLVLLIIELVDNNFVCQVGNKQVV